MSVSASSESYSTGGLPSPRRPLHPIRRWDVLLAVATAGTALTLYGRTLAPDLLLGDSAEFQTLTYTLGMSHPTGYPVYVLAARLFSLMPIGELAWRVNLFSAFTASLALGCMVLIARLLGGWRIAAVAGPAALAVSGLFWWQSILAELYAPAAALLSVVLLLVLLHRESQEPRYLAAAGVLGGLSLGVHNTVVLAAPAVLIYLGITPTSRKAWLSAAGGAVLGLALAIGTFLLLDLRDDPSGYYNSVARHALSIWGLSAADFDSPVERLEFLFAARQFRPFFFADGTAGLADNAGHYLEYLGSTFPSPLRTLILVGVVSLFVRRRQEAILLGGAWLAQMVFVLNYAIWDIEVFYIPSYVLLALMASYGLASLIDAVVALMDRIHGGRSAGTAIASGIGALLLVIGLRPAFPRVADSWNLQALSSLEGETAEYPYPVAAPSTPRTQAEALVARLEDDAIVFTDWDMLYALYFVARVEQGRRGMAFHETYPQDGVTQLAASTLAYIEANLGSRPIYFLDVSDPQLKRNFMVERVGQGTDLYRITGRR